MYHKLYIKNGFSWKVTPVRMYLNLLYLFATRVDVYVYYWNCSVKLFRTTDLFLLLDLSTAILVSGHWKQQNASTVNRKSLLSLQRVQHFWQYVISVWTAVTNKQNNTTFSSMPDTHSFSHASFKNERDCVGERSSCYFPSVFGQHDTVSPPQRLPVDSPPCMFPVHIN